MLSRRGTSQLEVPYAGLEVPFSGPPSSAAEFQLVGEKFIDCIIPGVDI